MRKDLIGRTQDILKWVAEGWSFTEMYKELGCSRDALHYFLKTRKIEYKGNQSRKGRKIDPKRKTALQLIDGIENGLSIGNSTLRDRLIQDKLKEYKCEVCGANEWFGKPIPLELHHKDFNHHNSKLENLQILCPNCHAYIHKYNIITPMLEMVDRPD